MEGAMVIMMTEKIDSIGKYYSDGVEITFNNDYKIIGISNGGDDVAIDIDDLNKINDIVKLLGWIENK